jgi:hypothetical protein
MIGVFRRESASQRGDADHVVTGRQSPDSIGAAVVSSCYGCSREPCTSSHTCSSKDADFDARLGIAAVVGDDAAKARQLPKTKGDVRRSFTGSQFETSVGPARPEAAVASV